MKGAFQRASANVGVQIDNCSLVKLNLTTRMPVVHTLNPREAAVILGVVCTGVLCGILVAGLWPFQAPPNDVTWLAGNRGVHFGRHGTILSSSELKLGHGEGELARSLEIWLTPASVWQTPSTVLAFYNQEDPGKFALRQSYEALALETDSRTQPHGVGRARLLLDHVFQPRRSVFITITSGPQRTAIWVNGSLAQTASPFPLESSGTLVVANSPVTDDSWSGDLRALAIYNSELTQEKILSHYKTWTTLGSAQLTQNDRAIALYLFDDGYGNIIRNRLGAGVDLYIPKHFMILNQRLLTPFWKEFSWDQPYWSAVLVNLAGFVPLGFFFCAYFESVTLLKRATLTTVALGLGVSLMIETLQGFLPTRDSGTTDVITNTLGTCLGTVLYVRTPARVLLARVFDRTSFVRAG
jgi:hypothetical protein